MAMILTLVRNVESGIVLADVTHANFPSEVSNGFQNISRRDYEMTWDKANVAIFQIANGKGELNNDALAAMKFADGEQAQTAAFERYMETLD